MECEEALSCLEITLPPGSLNSVKILVFQQAWQGKGYSAIAQSAGYDPDYIKGVAAQLWKSLSEILGEKVTKKNFRTLLLQRFKQQNSATSLEKFGQNSPSIDWGSAPDTSIFYGRAQELNQLQNCILNDGCRLIALLGLGGIGKTSLSIKVAKQIQDQFDYVIWRSLRNAPTPEEMWVELVTFLSQQQETEASVPKLLNYLRKSRCLLILDNVETILQAATTGTYRTGYQGYGELFQALGESAHQSCLLLTSREKPPEIAALEGIDFTVRSLHIPGSPEAAQAILSAKGIRGTTSQKQQLGTYYGNSPLAIKIVATSIQDLFDGNSAPFLAQETIAFNGICRLLEQQFQRLTPLAQTIMYWLAINREWTSLTQLHADIFPVVSKAKLLEAVESLTWHSLVEKQSGNYTLQPLVMEYISDKLIGQIKGELLGETGAIVPERSPFCHYALVQTTAKDYIRESQIRLIFTPIAEQLRHYFPTHQAIKQQIQTILKQLRPNHQEHFSSPPHPGYGIGNLINLCGYLNIDLTGYDFSHLPIWHAYLRNLNLHQVNFAQAHFAKTVFTQTIGGILKLVYSPDGRFLATADTQSKIQLWRVSDGQPHATFSGHCNWLWSLSFSPDGNLLASAGEDRVVRIWQLETGQCEQILPLDINLIWSLAFHPDGQKIAIAGSDHRIYVWHLDTNQVQILTGHSNDIHAVAFSQDGQILASGSHDCTVKLWELETGKCWQTLTGHRSLVYTVAFSRDGKTLASGSQDRTVKLWDLDTGNCQTTYTGHQDIVCTVDFHPDGQILASGSVDRTIRLWHLDSGQCLKILQGHQEMVYSLAFSPDGNTLASGSHDQTVKFWDIPSGSKIRTLRGYVNYFHALAWHPLAHQSHLLASGSTDQIVRIWDTSNGQCLKTLAGHQGWIWSVAWSQDGQMLASGSQDCTIRLWHSDRTQCIKTLLGHDSWVFALAWSWDGKMLASGSGDLTIKLWHPQTGKCLQTLLGHEDWVLSLAWSQDGKILASGGADCTLRLWDVETGKCLKILPAQKTWIWCVQWSRDGKTLASASDDHTIILWDVSQGEVIRTYTGHTSNVTHVTFSLDGQCLVSASQDRSIRVWDLHTGECLQILEQHTEAVFPVAFSQDGQTLASGSEDETIRLWDAKTWKCKQVLQVEQPYEGMDITGVSGLTVAQKLALKGLGAVEA